MKSKFLPAVILFMLMGRMLYAAAPAITSFSPASGPVGTLVTITGTNLGTPTTFSIGGKAAVVVSNNGTQLVGLVMPGALTGPVTIATSGGTAGGTGNFTITTRPAVNMVQSGFVLEGSELSTSQGYSVGISADGKTAVIGGVSGNNGGHYNAEIAYVFTYANDTWTLQAGLQGLGSVPDQGSSSAVAISADGNTILLGAQYDGSGAGGSGSVYAFTRTGTTWTQQGGSLIGTGSTSNEAHQGISVALSADGNTAAIGGWYDNSLVGATWIFTRSGVVWAQQGNKLIGTGYVGQSAQGATVALSADGNTLIEGGEFDNSNEGAAWVFTRSGSVWTQQGNKLVGNDVVTGGLVEQGHGVAISADGNTVMVGGPGDANAGAAWVYTRAGGSWTQQGSKLVGTGNSYKYANEGSSVALSADGNLALIGGDGDYTTVGASSTLGSTWEFSRSGTTWAQIGNKLVGQAGGGLDDQGFSVALSADGITALVGADERQSNQGSAYVFTTIAPSAFTKDASLITATSATLNGIVDENIVASSNQLTNYNLAATTVTIVYGTSPTLVTKTTATLTTGTSPMPGGASVTAFTSALTGLTPNTTYYFNISGTNSFGTANGNIANFTTGAGATQPETIKFAAPANEVYGSADFNPGATSTNATIPVTYASSNTAVATIVNNQVHIIGAGTTQVTASQAGNASYSAATPVIQAFTVTQAPLTITAANQTRVYNAPNPPLTVTYTGFVNGDTQQSLTAQATVTTTATAASAPGGYPITASGAAAPNYAITYQPGTLTISGAAPVATTLAASNLTYSGATISGTVNDNGAATTVQFQYSTAPDLSGAIAAPVATGISPVPAGGGTTTFTGVLTGLTVSTTYYFRISGTNSAGSTYGSIQKFTTSPPAVVTLTFTSPGYVYYGSLTTPLVSSNDPNSPVMYRFVTPGIAQFTNGKFQATGVGTSTIVAYQYASGTTNIEAVADGSITVIPAPLNIAADNKTIVWDQPAPAFTATYTGFVNGDTPANLPPAVLPDLRTPYLAGNSAGAYNIFNGPTGTSIQANYNITYTNGTLTVSQLYPKPIATTVAATDVNSTGATINGSVSTNQGPATTVTLQYTDNDDDGLQGLITATLTTGNSPLGAGSGSTDYSAVLTGLKPNTTYYFIINGINPEFTTTGNVMTFTTPGPISTPTIAFAPLAPVVYGSADVAPGATVTNSDIAISYTSSNTAVAAIVNNKIHVIGVGTSQITASLSGSAATPVTQAFTVTQAPLTIAAANQTRVYNAPNPPLTVTYTGFVAGDTQQSLTTQATVTTTATAASAPGGYPITASGAAAPNYAITYQPGTLTISGAAPIATTLAASNLTYSGATISGTVNDNGAATTVQFQYSTAPDLSGAITDPVATGISPVPAGGGTTTFTGVLTGLTPSTTYYFMISGTNSAGTTYGSIQKFSTSVQPVVTLTFISPGYVLYGSLTTPVVSSTDPNSPVMYRFVTPSVAQFTNGKFQAIGLGTSSIVAYQYAPGTTNIEAVADGSITVIPAPLTITADSKTIVWNQPAPAFTSTYTGFVNGDGPQSLPPGALPTLTSPYLTGNPAGTYNIFSGPTATSNGGNYNITYVNGRLTVTPLYPQPTAETTTSGSITATTATLYGDGNGHSAAATITFEYTTDDGDSFVGYTTVSPTGGQNPLPANSSDTTFAAAITGLAPNTKYYFRILSSNPEFTAIGNILTFTTPALPAQAITLSPLAPVIYGSADISPVASSTNVNTPITFTSSNTAVATIVNNKVHIIGVGSSQITASQVGSGVTPASQTLTVTPAPLTIAAVNETMTIGSQVPILTITYTGFVNNDTQASLTTPATATTTATSSSPVNTYPITVGGATDPNYKISYTNGTLTVTAALLTFNPIPPKIYGNADFDPGAVGTAITYSSSDTSTAVIISGLIHIKNAGTSIITASNSSGALQQTLTVSKAPLTIAANSQTKTYGSANPALTLSYSGFVYTDTPTKLNPQATATTTATVASITGTYPITAGGAASRDYSISYNSSTLTVSPAALTITADNKTIATGSPIPQLTATYSGFVNNDTQASLTTQPTITTTATINSAKGTYPITVGGAADVNYTITYKPGTLTINGPLTFSPIAAKTYGDPDFDPGAIGTAITYTSSNTSVATIVNGKIHITGAGTSTITVTSGSGGSAQQTLTINKAQLAITANNQVKAYGAANPALTLSYSGFVNNEDESVLTTQAIAATTATTTSAIGNYPITVSGATAANYTISYNNGTLAITIGTQSITFNPIPTKMYGAPDFDPGATASSGAAIIYSSSNTEVATIVDNQVHIISVGTATITATVAPNSNYSNTPTAMQLLTVTQATQTITFNPIPTQERKTTYDLSGVTASSGLPVTFTVSDMTVATINGTTLSSNELGTVTVTASQAGNANYLPAPSVAQTYTITDPNNDLVLVSFVVSPNGDGINDVLVVEGIENYPDNKMILINRNGVKVYEASGYNNSSRVFDGHSSITGALQQAGTLLYVLEYRVNGQMKRKTGFTELRY